MNNCDFKRDCFPKSVEPPETINLKGWADGKLGFEDQISVRNVEDDLFFSTVGSKYQLPMIYFNFKNK